MRITKQTLRSLETLCTGQCCSLKMDTGTERVWLCRVEGGITVETYDDKSGRWEITDGACDYQGAVYL